MGLETTGVGFGLLYLVERLGEGVEVLVDFLPIVAAEADGEGLGAVVLESMAPRFGPAGGD